VILFSHIPLSRPDGADCGPLRERGTLRRGSGIGYQNTLGRQMSQALIKDIKPVVVFRLVFCSGLKKWTGLLTFHGTVVMIMIIAIQAQVVYVISP
jgi:hypothetical protein